MKSLLQKFFNVRSEEVAPILLAALYFFCVLTALQVLRPAREALGMQRGIEAIRWLQDPVRLKVFNITMAILLVASFLPLVADLVL